MKNYPLFKICIILISFLYIQNSLAQGLNFTEKQDFDEIDRFENSDLGFAELIPYKYSLERFVPPVLNQGETSTCVGFAMGYYGISTMHNIYFNRTSFYEKFIHSFDPQYAYTINEVNCSQGLDMFQAFRRFTNFGAKKRFFAPLDIQCSVKPITNEQYDEISGYLAPYQLEKFEYIQTRNNNFIENVKINIAKNFPVMIATNITKSLYNVKTGSNQQAVWSPQGGEENEGGHAMCVVGYDDTINGGSFRIVNSWGTGWGDNGYFWLSYKDFYDRVVEAFVFKPYMLDFDEKGKDVGYYNDYQAYSYDNGKTNYEGSLNSDYYPNGLGIIVDKSKSYAIVGNFVNGYRNGKHLWITNKAFYRVDYDMGEIVRSEELGFAGESDGMESELSRYGDKMSLKTLNSKQIDSINKMGGVGKWQIRKPKQ